ncbi:MAG: alginate export family protein [Pseudomonadota bacterium]
MRAKILILFCGAWGFLLCFCCAATAGTVDLPKGNDLGGKSEPSFSVSGALRLRSEFQDEFTIKQYATGGSEDYLLTRLQVNFDAAFWKLKTFTQFQDARIFWSSFEDSDFKVSNPYHDVMDIRQAYVNFEPSNEIEVKLGRQQIGFGDRRVFGPGDWGNTGRYVWDAARVRFHNALLDSHFLAGRFILRNPDRWPNESAPGPTAYANYTMVRNLPFELDLFYVLKKDDHGDTQGETGKGNLTSHSTGFRLDGKRGSWDYAVTVVHQFGRWGNDRIDAYGLTSRIGYTFDMPWQPHLMAQYIHGSGDKDPRDGKKETFDGVFGGSDTVLYGWMNLFFWSNLREYRLDLELTPRKVLSVRGEYHYFTLDETKDAWYYPGSAQRRDKTGRSGRELGHEWDLTLRYKPVAWLDLLGGYCIFLPGEFIERTGPDPPAQWFFLQTEMTF